MPHRTVYAWAALSGETAKSAPQKGRWHGEAVTDEVLVCTATRIAVRRNPPHFFLHVQKETGWSLKERARQRGLLAPLWKPPARRLVGIRLPTIAVTAHPCNLRSRYLARTQAVRALRWRLLRFGCDALFKPSPGGGSLGIVHA